MCKELCDVNQEMQTCPDCSRLICWDLESGDDVSAPACFTAGGDVYCERCACRHDIAEEEEYEPDDCQESF